MVLKKKFHILIATFLLISISCKEEFPVDTTGLTYRGKFIYDNQIKMNGLYYWENSNEGYLGVKYFFIDGTYYHVGIENYSLPCDCFEIKERNIPYSWGYFIINIDTLKVQTYDPTSKQRYGEFRVEERWAMIENDSTIRFFKKITPEKKTVQLNETFKFYVCNNKPDSTNVLMKY